MYYFPGNLVSKSTMGTKHTQIGVNGTEEDRDMFSAIDQQSQKVEEIGMNRFCFIFSYCRSLLL